MFQFRRFTCLLVYAIVVTSPSYGDQPADDPLAPILQPVLRPAVEMLLEYDQGQRSYTDADFPMKADRFAAFQREVVTNLARVLQLEDWQVRAPLEKSSPLAGRFIDRTLKTIRHHGIAMEVHVVEFPQTGQVVPMVICLPEGDDVRPGICTFSGHTKHGLRDLVLDLTSYQAGIATRLAQAGFVAIAVEKVDAGYLSRDGNRGNDEPAIATFRLASGRVTRSHQLMACLAASEILATHPRVDHRRIGATGVSLGGWLSTQTALLSDRIQVVADFGRKTLLVHDGTTVENFQGIRDLCHILPGMHGLCERNLLALAYCPRPLLAGHGKQDAESERDGPTHFQKLFASQYAALGQRKDFEYLAHGGGDTMPADEVINYFRQSLALDAK